MVVESKIRCNLSVVFIHRNNGVTRVYATRTGYHKQKTPVMRSARSVGHDLRLGMSVGGITHVDVHLVSVTSAVLRSTLLFFLVLALALDVDTAILGHLIIIRNVFALAVRDTDHSGVVDSAVGSRALAVRLSSAFDSVLLQIGLVSTVLLLIDVQVSLWLFGGKLGRGSGIVIPA